MDFLKGRSSSSGATSKGVDTKKENKNNSETRSWKKHLETYRDPTTGVTLKRLKFGLWIEESLPLFKKLLVLLLICACIGLWVYAVIGFGWYIFKGMEEDEKMINELSRRNLISHEELLQRSTDQLNIDSVQILGQRDNYDLAVRVQNINERYRATYDYCFVQGEEEIDCGENFVFPEETKYILSLDNELDSTSNIDFQIKDRNWRQINYREINNWDQFLEERSSFVFDDVNFDTASQNERSGREGLNTLTFTATNDTPYGYWEVPLNIFFYDTGNIVGVNRYVIHESRSGEEKNIELVWSDKIGRITDVEIRPDLNIMDKDIYIKTQEAAQVDRFTPEQ